MTRGRNPFLPLLFLLLITLAGLVWYAAVTQNRNLGAWPLLLVGVAVAIRAGEFRDRGRNSEELRGTQRNSGELTQHSALSTQHSVLISIFLLIFGLTALVGANVAYDPIAGWGKFWVLLASILLLAAIVSQPAEARWPLLALLSGLAGLVALDFLFTHDWQLFPADIGVVNRLGLAWMNLRPQLPFPSIHPNLAGGMLIMLLPFQVAGVGTHRNSGERSEWASGRVGESTLNTQYSVLSTLPFLLLLGLSLFALLLTSSRGAWLSLAAATGVYLLWWLSGWLGGKVQRPRQTIFLVGLGLGIAAAIFLVLVFPGGLIGLVNRLPGLASGQSRWEIYQNTSRLVRDFPFTGGGLHAFPGLYSQYILTIPYFLFDYSHNLYLDVLLEHGIIGFAAFMAVLGGSLVGALQRELKGTRRNSEELSPQSSVLSPHTSLRWAAIVSLVAVLLHGLMDNALHGSAGTPFLFVPVAMALWASKGDGEKRPTPWGFAAAFLLFFLLAMILVRPQAGAWSANLAAIRLAQVELDGWPELERETNGEALAQAQNTLEAIHENYPDNQTVNYRLGLLASREQAYAAALPYLQTAYQSDPGHRGVIKTLGYSYVWLGQLEEAQPLLSQIPEAPTELETYSWWWGTQAQPDRADQASRMLIRLTQP